MKMTIGTKLGLGFSTIIALLAISAGIAYYNIRQIRANASDVLDVSVPMVRASNDLLDSLNAASAALRGYLLLTAGSERANMLRQDNQLAWERAESHWKRLADLASASKSFGQREQVQSLERLIGEQRSYHQQVLQIAAATDNVPARYVFNKEITPRAEQMLELLATIIDEEGRLDATAERKQLLKALADCRGAAAVSIAELRAFLTAGDDESKESFSESELAGNQAFESVLQREAAFNDSQKQSWARFVALRQQAAPFWDEVVRLRSGADWNRAEHMWETQSQPLGKEIRQVLAQITGAAVEIEKGERRELETASQRTVAALGTATAVAILVGCAIAFYMSRSMVQTVRGLADRALEISQGDLTGSTIIAKGADELGQLADGFNVMMSNLRDLTGQILTVTENVNSAASQISSSAKQQATSTKEQAATVQEITSTMQEISRSGAQIVAKAKEVAAVAEQASTSSKTGIDAVQNTSRTMEAIREQVEEVAENIVALSERTQAVGEIISTVNELAEQSNLLALNATIEAAEAGAEGTRFAVVAAEMKNLADQAKECTVHVRKILSEIQRGINTSVMLTEEAVKRVETGKEQADVSENVIRQISSTTEESIQAFQQIIGATNQQQVGFEQVAQGMQDIDQATQQTATGTAQLEQAVVSLSALGKQLQTAVASYRM